MRTGKEEEMEQKRKWLVGIVSWKSPVHHWKRTESEAMKPFLERSFEMVCEAAMVWHVEFWRMGVGGVARLWWMRGGLWRL